MQIEKAGFIFENDFSIQFILARTIDVFLRHPVIFLGLPFIAALPAMMLEAALGDILPQWMIVPVYFFMRSLGVGAMVYAVLKINAARSVTVTEAIVRGLKPQIAPILVTAAIVNLAVVLGLFFLVVPGLFIMCLWSMSMPVCLAERLQPPENLMRSAELTDGYRLKIFALIVVYYLLMKLFALGGLELAGFMTDFLIDNHMILTLAEHLAAIFPSGFYGIMVTLIYSDLRLTEGLNYQDLADLID